jgi:F-type H+-transporting ATPase subunit gamma
MASLRDIRRRIRSVRNTQQITKAMKMVAASKLRKAQARLMAIRPYEQAVGEMLHTVLARLMGDENPLLIGRGGKRVSLILITGDKGLSGAFNNNAIRRAESFVRERSGQEVTVTAIGKKGARYYLKTPGHRPAAVYTGLSEAVTFAQSAAIMSKQVANYLAGECDEVHVIYSYFQSAIAQQVRVEKLLPFETAEAAREAPAAPQEVFLLEPSDEEVAEKILTESLNIRLFRALLESASSEHGARMTSMDNATKSADDIIAALTQQFNRARQSMITTEIAEIVGGAEALNK